MLYDRLLVGASADETLKKFEPINPFDYTYAVIGQGFVGKSAADWMVEEGFTVQRVDIKTTKSFYKRTKAEVFIICVPTPTKKRKFDSSIIDEVVDLIPNKSVVIIRSTIPPYLFTYYEQMYPEKLFVVAPEFLDADTAEKDYREPRKLILGWDSEKFYFYTALRSVFPHPASIAKVILCSGEEACMIKLASNAFFTVKNVFFNGLADIAHNRGMNPASVIEGVTADDRIGKTHTQYVHKGGRGAGGPCLPKDFETFRNLGGMNKDFCDVLEGISKLNERNLRLTGKDIKIVDEVY